MPVLLMLLQVPAELCPAPSPPGWSNRPCSPPCLAPPQIGNDNFCELLAQIRGPEAVAEWQQLQRDMRPLAQASALMPPAALRADAGVLVTALARYLPSLLQSGGAAMQLTGPFSNVRCCWRRLMVALPLRRAASAGARLPAAPRRALSHSCLGAASTGVVQRHLLIAAHLSTAHAS
jgi:hypothetical protein